MMPGQSTFTERLVGELIRKLHDEKFVITIEDSKRLVFVTDNYLKEVPGLTHEQNRKVLAGMLGPVICSTALQQENFWTFFEAAYQCTTTEKKTTGDGSKTAAETSTKKNKRSKWIYPGLGIMTITALVITFILWPRPQNGKIDLTQTPVADTADTIKERTDSIGRPKMMQRDSLRVLVKVYEGTVTFAPNKTKIIITSILVGLLIAQLLYAVTYDKKRARHITKAPYAFSFSTRDDEIEGSADFDEWTRQLEQREEGNHRVLDLFTSIKSTVRGGGFPKIVFKQLKRRPHYLLLLDSRSAYDQRNRLFDCISTMLYQNGIDVDFFYFHSTPDYCWSDRYPQGLKTEALQQQFPFSYVILVAEGRKLVDQEGKSIAAWVTKLFAAWPKRAIITPVSVEQWGFIERTLSTFFVLLPFTTSGQLVMRRFMDETSPTFEDLKTRFSTTSTEPGVILGSNLDVLSVDEIESYVKTECQRQSIDEPFTKMLVLWAHATSVYAKPSFEITVAIGKALERANGVYGLVTTRHLSLITSLPWLRRETIPTTLRDKLLGRLRKYDNVTPLEQVKKTEQIARDAVIEVLKTVTLEPNSRAFEEQQLQYWEQIMLSGRKEHSTTQAMRKLRSYERAGLVLNKSVANRVKSHFNIWKWITVVALTLALLSMFSFVEPPATLPDNTLSFFFDQRGQVDSAAHYNNKAVDFASTDTIRVDSAANYLKRSIAFRPIPEAFRNVIRLRINSVPYSSVDRITYDGITNIPTILKPITSPKLQIITFDTLISYFTFLASYEESRSPTTHNDSIWYARIYREKSTADILAAKDSLLQKIIRINGNVFIIPDHMRDSLNEFIFHLYASIIVPVRAKPINPDQLPPTDDDTSRVDPTIPTQPGSYERDSREQIPANSRSTEKDDTTTVNLAKPDTTKEGFASNLIRSKRGTIPGNYGILKGRLKKINQDNKFVYLEIISGNDHYQVALSKEGDSNTSTAGMRNNVILTVGKNPKIHYQMKRNADGFMPLEKNANTGAVNYINMETEIKSGESIDGSSFLAYLDGYKGIYEARVYVWGGQVKAGKGWEMNDVHMNQGSTLAAYLTQNAPWQDGAVVFEMESGETFAVFIRFETQSFKVDENGQPLE